MTGSEPEGSEQADTDGIQARDIHGKPDADICPRQFCFFWRMGQAVSRETPEPPAVEQGCRCGFGRCTRLEPVHGDRDWYEPHGPNLDAVGLPWFFFIPAPELVRAELSEQYIAESSALWGPRHWLPSVQSEA